MPNGRAILEDYWENEFTDYRMYLVLHGYFEDYAPLEPFIQIVINFGRKLGEKATMIVPMKGAYDSTRCSVLGLSWEPEMRQELDRTRDPYILVIRKPLSAFRPDEDEYIIMQFPEAISNTSKYIEILDEIWREINAGNDIFAWKLESRTKVTGKFLQRLFEAIEAKPGVFGFSINLKRLFTGR
jgi:hypothetical protein